MDIKQYNYSALLIKYHTVLCIENSIYCHFVKSLLRTRHYIFYMYFLISCNEVSIIIPILVEEIEVPRG